MNPQQPVLNVAPLNCVPCIGPTNPDDIFSSPVQANAEAAETLGPAMIYLPSQSTREELNDIMNATRNGVVLTGSVLAGTMGPRIGQVDIGESADSYYFRVILPGEDLYEDNAFVVMPTFFKDQISDLPENFPPNDNIQFGVNGQSTFSSMKPAMELTFVICVLQFQKRLMYFYEPGTGRQFRSLKAVKKYLEAIGQQQEQQTKPGQGNHEEPDRQKHVPAPEHGAWEIYSMRYKEHTSSENCV
ncbi:hypothetical protein PTKIN_Ptkin06aG0203600 [Pterospermum kingtungense]